MWQLSRQLFTTMYFQSHLLILFLLLLRKKLCTLKYKRGSSYSISLTQKPYYAYLFGSPKKNINSFYLSNIYISIPSTYKNDLRHHLALQHE